MSAERHWRSVAITKLYRTDVAELSRHAAHTAVRKLICELHDLAKLLLEITREYWRR